MVLESPNGPNSVLVRISVTKANSIKVLGFEHFLNLTITINPKQLFNAMKSRISAHIFVKFSSTVGVRFSGCQHHWRIVILAIKCWPQNVFPAQEPIFIICFTVVKNSRHAPDYWNLSAEYYLPLFTVSLMMPRRISNDAKSFPSLPSLPAAPCQSGYFGNLCFKEANG